MSLIEDAKAAKKAGMTYGQYMMKKPFKPYKRTPEKKLTCINCGAPLIRGQQKYCSSECRVEMRIKNTKGDLFV